MDQTIDVVIMAECHWLSTKPAELSAKEAMEAKAMFGLSPSDLVEYWEHE